MRLSTLCLLSTVFIVSLGCDTGPKDKIPTSFPASQPENKSKFKLGGGGADPAAKKDKGNAE